MKKKRKEKKTFEHKTKTISKLNKVRSEKRRADNHALVPFLCSSGNGSRTSSPVYQNGKLMVKRHSTIEYELCVSEYTMSRLTFVLHCTCHIWNQVARYSNTYLMNQINANIVRALFSFNYVK